MDFIFEEEKKYGRAMLIEQIDDKEYILYYVHLYNKHHDKFIGFEKNFNNLKSNIKDYNKKEAYKWMIYTLFEQTIGHSKMNIFYKKLNSYIKQLTFEE